MGRRAGAPTSLCALWSVGGVVATVSEELLLSNFVLRFVDIFVFETITLVHKSQQLSSSFGQHTLNFQKTRPRRLNECRQSPSERLFERGFVFSNFISELLRTTWSEQDNGL